MLVGGAQAPPFLYLGGVDMRKMQVNMTSDIYECQYDWPEDCFIQGGKNGVVFSEDGNYTTAYFEAFPEDPKTFIRGEGETLKEAEQSAWDKLQKYKACEKHVFERRGYENGMGFCKHCGMSKSEAFEPTTKCPVCGKPNYFGRDVDGNMWCEEHYDDMPEDKKPDYIKRAEEWNKEFEEWREQQS